MAAIITVTSAGVAGVTTALGIMYAMLRRWFGLINDVRQLGEDVREHIQTEERVSAQRHRENGERMSKVETRLVAIERLIPRGNGGGRRGRAA